MGGCLHRWDPLCPLKFGVTWRTAQAGPQLLQKSLTLREGAFLPLSSFKCKQKNVPEVTACSCLGGKNPKNKTLKALIHFVHICGFIVTLIFLFPQRFRHCLGQHTVVLLSKTLVKLALDLIHSSSVTPPRPKGNMID